MIRKVYLINVFCMPSPPLSYYEGGYILNKCYLTMISSCPSNTMDNFDFPQIWDISYIISHSQHAISLFLHKKHLIFRIYNISKMPLSHLFSRKQRARQNVCIFNCSLPIFFYRYCSAANRRYSFLTSAILFLLTGMQMPLSI